MLAYLLDWFNLSYASDEKLAVFRPFKIYQLKKGWSSRTYREGSFYFISSILELPSKFNFVRLSDDEKIEHFVQE